MSFYDAIIVLGSKPNITNWEFPSHVYASLDTAAKHWRDGRSAYIIVSGKWALSFDKHNITQPYRECDKMAEYLLRKGIPDSAILREGESKDTISNIFYIKRTLLVPNYVRNVCFIVADFRIARLQYLTQKILGNNYTASFIPIACPAQEIYPQEAHTFMRTKKFLANMQDGDDAFLEDAFYAADYYQTTN